MKVKVQIDLDINEVAVAYEYGIEIDEVADFVKECASNDLYQHYSGLGWLRERTYT